ncbi:DUF1524 domain-containing protein [Stackebrandtia soli]|uniref:GmrSD restriction endonuclease domain-containing protein n=1 Tax=Stackebrandtia soli TaxID=1892856 RepID=UPI0039EB1A5A
MTGTFISSTRRLLVVALAACALVIASLSVADPAHATAPNIPSKATALAELAALTVTPEGSSSGYDRAKFPHWQTVSGSCNAREMVLQRDGIDVSVGSDCQPTAGRWYSPYDGVTLYSSSDVDIDHVVPLAEAWRSGASGWTQAKREAFANDLSYPQLRASSASSNRSKSDSDPTEWKPMSSYQCTYAKMWVRSKYHWGLTLQSAEKSALQTMLNTC